MTQATGSNSKRLLGWKAIGQFLGCTERTARRWEADREMPVHRVPGRSRSSVWASPDELTAWLNSLPSAIQADIRSEAASEAQRPYASHATADSVRNPRPESGRDLGPGPTASQGKRLPNSKRLLVGVLCLVLVIFGASLWRWTNESRGSAAGRGDSGTPYDDDALAREEYRSAQFELSTRSAASIAAASAAFRHLTERYPERDAGWSGLADTYLLSREFGTTSEADAYAGAERAARTAIGLNPKSADAWLELAFVNFWSDGDFEAGLKEFQTGLQLNPSLAKGWLWYGNALAASRHFDDALATLAHARTLDPDNRAIIADESFALFLAGQRDAAIARMERLVRIDPDFLAWHTYLRRCYLVLGRDEDFLREAFAIAKIRGDTDALARLAVVSEKYKSGGRPAMLDQLTRDAVDAWRNTGGSPVIVAVYRAQAKDRAGVVHWLSVAAVKHDTYLIGLLSAPEFNDYWNDPAVRQLAVRKR